MSRTSAPVLTSLLLPLLLLLLLLAQDSAAVAAAVAVASKQLESKSCKTLDEVLLDKYVTSQKRSSSNDDVSENATSLPSGSTTTDFNWRDLYLLLQDRAEQLCDKKLFDLLYERYSDGAIDEIATSNRQENATAAAVATAVPQLELEDQQANDVTLSSTAQKGSILINASTTSTYNNDESSGKFLEPSTSEEDSTTSYYDSSSSTTTTLSGNFNRTFTMTDNEANGNNSNETLARDNEDESDRNEAIHSRSKEDFLASVLRDKDQQFGQDADDDAIVEKFSEAEDKIIDGDGSTSLSKEIDNNSTINESDQLVGEFFANKDKNLSSSSVDNDNRTVSEHDEFVDDFFANESDDSFGYASDENTTVSEHDKFVDDFFASTSEDLSNDNNTASEHDEFVDDFFANESGDSFGYASDENTTVSEHDKFVDDFFASTSEDLSNDNNTTSERDEFLDAFFANESKDVSSSEDIKNVTVSEHDKLVDDFFANESKDSGSKSEASNDNDKFVDEFFASENENLLENGIRRSETTNGHRKKMLDGNQSNETASVHDQLEEAFFASEKENLTSNGIESEGPNKDSSGTLLLDDKANNNKTASSEFNSTKSHSDVSSRSTEELTPTMESFVANLSSEQENVTNWEESTTNSSAENENSTEVPLTKSLEEFTEEGNFTYSEVTTEFFNNTSSSENFTSKLENSTEIPVDSSELISSPEFQEVAISEEKNATEITAAQLQMYSNETATSANGTEDRSAKYPDTGDRDKAGHTPSSHDDLFKETTTTTTPSLDDWSSTIASIESPNEASEPTLSRRRRRNILMTFRRDSGSVASAGKLRAPEASGLVDRSSSSSSNDEDAWESSRDSSLNAQASSRNRPPRIITVEMNKGSDQLQRQYRTFLLGLQSGQTQFAEKRDSRSSSSSK